MWIFALGLALAAAAVFPLAPVGGGRACAGGTNHAGEAIRFSPTEERRFCIDFSEQEISGIRALRLTGLPVVTKTHPQYGEFVCKIGEVGHDSSDCPATDGSYWAYFYLHSAGIWYPWSQGASFARVRCGAAEGWAWFPRGVGAPPSAPASFASICSGRTCQQEASRESFDSVGSTGGRRTCRHRLPNQTAGPGGGGFGCPGRSGRSGRSGYLLPTQDERFSRAR